MNVIDYLILAMAAVGAIGGFLRGGIRNLVTAGGLFLGIISASRYSPQLASFLDGFLKNDDLSRILAFVIVLGICFIIFSIIGSCAERALKSIGLGGVNRVVGAAFGGLLSALVTLGLILLISRLFEGEVHDALENSRLAEPLMPLLRRITGIIKNRT